MQATNWAEAVNGKPDPFALALIAAAGGNNPTGAGTIIQTATPMQEEMSAQEKAKQAALLEAAEQFL